MSVDHGRSHGHEPHQAGLSRGNHRQRWTHLTAYDPYVPGTARPQADQRFTRAVKPEKIGLEAIEEGAAEPADLRSPALASGSAFVSAFGSSFGSAFGSSFGSAFGSAFAGAEGS
ncbi:hypothetical protein MY1884_008933 [Beauveria asiatica]